MKWFKCKHSTCRECGVHFEPVTGYESKWGDLCAAHRKPVMERDQKRDAVISWATANWERLYEVMQKENEETREQYNILARERLNRSMNAQMNANQANQYPSQLGFGALGSFGSIDSFNQR